MSTSNTPLRADDGGYELTEILLSKAHLDFHVNFRGYFLNHLSHGLYTVCALGGIQLTYKLFFPLFTLYVFHSPIASKSRIQEFYDMYVKRLEPLRESELNINSSNWSQNIGNEK